MQARTIFITGTDTGVGKTLLTASLLHHLLQSGVNALAMKPFCSGGRQDVGLIQAIQSSRLPDDEINPFYFAEPVAPLVAARKVGRRISLAQVLGKIKVLQSQCDCLLIEGSGGLMVPLGEGYSVAKLIERLGCEVIVVARNRLGTLNHTLLTVAALRREKKRPLNVVLMDEAEPDFSASTNRAILAETLAPTEVWPLPFLGQKALEAETLKNNAKKVKKRLASILRSDKVLERSFERMRLSSEKSIDSPARRK